MSHSYAIIHHNLKIVTIVNGGPWDQVDVVVSTKSLTAETNNMEILDYYPGIETELLYDDYETQRMMFTVNDDGSIAATYLFFKEREKRSRRMVDYVVDENTHKVAMRMARFVLWCECYRNGDPKAVEGAMKTSKLGNEKQLDGEICVICLVGYHAEDMIGTLRCNHSYHQECIKTWLVKKRECPLCRNDTLAFIHGVD